ncbi:MAG TPA: hypothetical protein VHH15_14745 [Actinophytocola sp.]|nr:hypothetical protein [Actinophytocola sp.]
MSTGATIVLIVVVVAVVLAAGWFVAQRMRSQRLRSRFGPEYDRRIAETDDRRAAERELAERQKRHAALDLRPLSDGARARYAEQWALVQERFVDQPREAVVEAESLVDAVMRERGYPTDGFDQQAADLSVEHASAVDHYRSGHDIRLRHEQADVSTEELRKALVHYRAVFDSVAGAGPGADTERRYDDAAR